MLVQLKHIEKIKLKLNSVLNNHLRV